MRRRYRTSANLSQQRRLSLPIALRKPLGKPTRLSITSGKDDQDARYSRREVERSTLDGISATWKVG